MRTMALLILTLLAAAGTPGQSAAPPPVAALDARVAAGFAALALKCLHTEYPSHISHSMASDADARPPHLLTPAFYGCYDWHSDVHGHWLLVRLLRLFPDAPFAAAARSELARSFTAENVAGEVAYLMQEGRTSFERCASGPIRRRKSGPAPCDPSRLRPHRASAAGCRNSTIPSGSASTTRPRFPSD